MDKINFQNGVTKVNADTFNTLQNNIESAINDISSTTVIDNLNKMQADLQKEIRGTILYEDSTGTTEDITLSDEYTNYKEVKIVYKCSSTQLATFNSKEIPIIEATQNINLEEKYIGSTYIYIYNAYVSLAENNKIVFNANRTAQINAETFVVDTNNPISVVKVIGYKEA